LNRTPWRINQDVYNIALEAWSVGLEIGKQTHHKHKYKHKHKHKTNKYK